jgi:uncharacterized protein (DUF2236 family)
MSGQSIEVVESRAPRRRRRRQPRELRDLLTLIGLTNGVANIIMQLSLPPVGHGVSESRVHSGSPRRYPLKRARTTGQYLALSVMGSDEDRAVMRAEVAKVHAAVHSQADSPVKYSGNSRELQVWVAMCLFKYYLDQYTLVHGPLDEPTLDVLTRAAEPLATGVNCKSAEWPQTWAEYCRRWDETLPTLSIDPVVHHEFETLSDLSFLGEAWGTVGYALARVGGPAFRFMTRATLPPEFRAMMGWDWTDADERRLQRALRAIRVVDRVINPYAMQTFYRAYIADFRLRRRLGRPVLGRLNVIDTRIRDGGGLRRLARARLKKSA